LPAERRRWRAARSDAGDPRCFCWAKWLGEETALPEKPKALLVSYPDEWLKLWPVNRQKMGSVRNKTAEVFLPETG
jgi:hypothetical protein